MSGAGFAQEAATGNESADKKFDTIVVTGSRIRKVDSETEAPVLTITRADIEKQGFQSVSDILQNITATGTPPISRASPLSAGENAGGTFISMRNLGAARTLVLLNGKRLGISTSGLSDVSTIPAVAVERIEVLKDGASSIYGSDAIAGVINIITRTNYNGAAASAYYGEYDKGDGAITKGDFVMGFGGDRGSLTVTADWTKEESVAATDRSFSAYPRSDRHPDLGWTTVGQYGGFAVAGSTPVPGFTNGRYILRDGADPYNRSSYRPQNVDSNSPLDKSNTNEQIDLRTPLENKSLYADGLYKLTDSINFRTNLLYSNRVSDRTVAGYPLQSASFSQTSPGISVNSYYNPVGTFHAPTGTTPQALRSWWRRAWEVPRESESELDTYRFSGAFEGKFEFADRYFDWDVSYLKNTNKVLQSSYGNLNLPRVQLAVGPSFLNTAINRVQCGTAAAPIPFSSCVPWNPLLPYGAVGDGSLTDNQQLTDFLFQQAHATGKTETSVFAANITGQVMRLPAGDLGFALGVEHRKEEGRFSPDSLAVTGDSTDLSAGPTGGGYDVDEAYLELQVPIFAEQPFAQELSVDLASRYSDYNTFGSTTNNKVGFRWKPIDQLLFRGTWAEGFRAPTIADLYGGGSQTFSFFTDPCDVQFGGSRDASSPTRANCRAALGPAADTFRQLGQGFQPVTTSNAQTPVAFTSGSNPFLLPENSTSKTLGVVWSPTFVRELNFSLDWWHVHIDDTIVADSPNQILSDCYNDGISGRCGLFTRDPALGYINSLRFGGRNAGFRETEGYDFDASYRLPTDNWGTFSTQWNTTYTVRDEFLTTNDPAATTPSQNTSFGSNFRVRSNLNVGWEYGAFGASWNVRYYSAMKETCLSAALFPEECSNPGYRSPNITGVSIGTPVNVSSSTTFQDVQVRWSAPWNATVSVGANNVFDRQGPILYSQPSSNVSYYGGFDIGRFWYVRYTQRF